MPKSAYQLFKDKVNPLDVGNPYLRRQLRQMYDQNYRQQLNQVNANYQAGLAQGLTPGQAATTWVLPNGPNAKYTVKDGQGLPDIAKTTGSTPADIVNANPQMTTPQTGMILNVPKPPDFTGISGLNGTQYSNGPQTPKVNAAPDMESMRTSLRPPAATPKNPFAPNTTTPNQFLKFPSQQPPGGFGLPSNAALGATTPNPQGTNPNIPSFYPQGNAGQALVNAFGALGKLPQPAKNPAIPSFYPQGNAGQALLNMFNPSANGAAPLPSSNGLPGAPISPMPNIPPSNLSPVFAQKLQTGDLTPDELKYAIYKGWIAPANRPQGGTQNLGIAFPKGNPNYNFWNSNRGKGRGGGGGGGRGGGGRGGGVPPRYTQQDNNPAFGSGAGFGGLVNWRI